MRHRGNAVEDQQQQQRRRQEEELLAQDIVQVGGLPARGVYGLMTSDLRVKGEEAVTNGPADRPTKPRRHFVMDRD